MKLKPRKLRKLATWPPARVISKKTLDRIVHELAEAKLLTATYKYFCGDIHYWAVEHDIAWYLLQQSNQGKLLRSGTVIVKDPSQLQPNTTILERLPDGSVRVAGESGDCDEKAAVFYGDVCYMANAAGSGRRTTARRAAIPTTTSSTCPLASSHGARLPQAARSCCPQS